MPIIGIMASANWASANASSFESIATVTAAGGESTLSFTSIPQTYKHLQIRIIAKDTNTTQTNGAYGLLITFNNDTGTNYTYHQLNGNGSAASATGSASQNSLQVSYAVTSSGATIASIYGASIVDILDYTSTSKYKTVRSLNGTDGNIADTSWRINLGSGLWMSTSAITRIDFAKWNTGFAAGTTFALYGIRG